MPSFAVAAAVRDSGHGLQVALNARLEFVAGLSSATVYTLKGRVSDDVDVIVESDLIVSLCGTVDRAAVGARKVQSSAIAQHLLNYFHVNGDQLGFRVASKPYIDEEDNVVKLTLNSTRPVLERRSASVRLCAMKLHYVCKTQHAHAQSGVHEGISAAMDPFSSHAFLPLAATLDRLVERFVVLHLVKRYPLVFGPWREQFDAEVGTCAKIARAVTDTIARSPHAAFRKRCRHVLKVAFQLLIGVGALELIGGPTQRLHNNHVIASAKTLDSLSVQLSGAGVKDTEEINSNAQIDEESDYGDVLNLAMERLLKYSLKPMRYQGARSAAHGKETGTSVDDDFQLSDAQADAPNPLGSSMNLAPGPDSRERIELWFDEETEVEGSQEEDLLFGDDSELGDDDIWVSDEADTVYGSSLCFDSDDFWDSSQSTLDDPNWHNRSQMLDSSQSSMLSDPSPRPAMMDCSGPAEDDDVWLNDFEYTPNEWHSNFDSDSEEHQEPSRSSNTFSSIQYELSLGHLPLASQGKDSQAPPSTDETQASRFSSSTSDLPILFGGDLSCEMDMDMDTASEGSRPSSIATAKEALCLDGGGKPIGHHEPSFDFDLPVHVQRII